jgi:predicted lactoylglutathione lyase
MSNAQSRKMFANLAAKDLGRSMDFFRGLGFQFDPKFTNDKGACMIISEEAYVMLLSEPFFKTFTKKEICETASDTEGLFALSCDSRAEVDDLVNKAKAAGGKPAMDPQDGGSFSISMGITGRSSGWIRKECKPSDSCQWGGERERRE